MRKKLVLILFSVLFVCDLFSQSNYDSPYSRFGIGDVTYRRNTPYSNMGGLGVSSRSIFCVGYLNPASYAAYDSLSFVFNVGSSTNGASILTDTARQNVNSTTISHLLFGFPAHSTLSASDFPKRR